VSIRDVSGVPIALPDQELPKPGTRPEEAARAFESYYCEMLLTEMERTVQGGISGGTMGPLSALVSRAVADAMAAGGGIGIGKLLQSGLENTSAPAVHTPGPTPLEPKALPIEGTVTSGFGMRVHPILGDWRMHQGMDIGAEAGTPIHPLAAGVVTRAEEARGYGKVVVVDHGNGWSTLYAHCEAMDVSPGDRVTPSSILGQVGSTGLSTGPHLHLEVHENGQAIDPASVILERSAAPDTHPNFFKKNSWRS